LYLFDKTLYDLLITSIFMFFYRLRSS